MLRQRESAQYMKIPLAAILPDVSLQRNSTARKDLLGSAASVGIQPSQTGRIAAGLVPTEEETLLPALHSLGDKGV